MSDKTTYESLDNRIAPEALTKDYTKGLAVVDGHAVKSQEDYEDPDRLYGMLIARIRKYHPSTDVSLIEKAYKLAVEAHGDQRRKSGEPYIIHPLWVAIILADLEMDKETIAAGMLHDVVEDTKFTEEDIRKEFGAEVALLVDGVTKLGRLSYSSDKLEVQAENLRKMFLAMAKDIRVIIIKLADRLHNMRTLQFMTPAKQKEKAKTGAYSYVGISKTTHQDESGNTVDYTDEEKEELAAKVADFAKAAKEDGLDAAAEDAGYTVSTGTFTQEDDSVDDNLLAALKNLKEGEVTDLIDGDSSYFVARLDKEVDEDATEETRQSIIEQRKDDLYDETLDGWKEGIEWAVKEKVWDDVNFDNLFTTIKDTETESTTEQATE